MAFLFNPFINTLFQITSKLNAQNEQLPKEPELPMPEPQLPEINIENTTNVNNNDDEQQL